MNQLLSGRWRWWFCVSATYIQVCKQVRSDQRDAMWNSWTCTLGFPVMGACVRASSMLCRCDGFIANIAWLRNGRPRDVRTGALTCALSAGIWQSGMDGTDINACDRSPLLGPYKYGELFQEDTPPTPQENLGKVSACPKSVTCGTLSSATLGRRVCAMALPV